MEPQAREQLTAYLKLEDVWLGLEAVEGSPREDLPPMRALIEAMHVAGLVFARGSQAELIDWMDRQDAEAAG